MILPMKCKIITHKDEQIIGICQSVDCKIPNRLVCFKCLESHLKDNICQIQEIKNEKDLNAIIQDYISGINTRVQNSITYCQTSKYIKIKELQKYIESWSDGYKKFDYLETIIRQIKLDQTSLKLEMYLNDNNSLSKLDHYLNNSFGQFIKIEKYMKGHPNYMIEQEGNNRLYSKQNYSNLMNIQFQYRILLKKLNDQIQYNLQMNNDEILQLIKNQQADHINNYENLQDQLGIINNYQSDDIVNDEDKNMFEYNQELQQNIIIGIFLFFTGQGSNQIGLLDELLEFYNHIIQKFPRNQQALENLGNFFKDQAKIYVQKKQYKNAVQQYDKCIQINPYEYRLYQNKANLLLHHLNNVNDALKCYEEYCKIDNTNYNANIQKAQIYQKQNNYSKALECFNEYVKIDPNYHKKQQFQKAFQNCCDQSIKYDQTNHQFTLIQNCQWFQQEQDYKTALQLYVEYMSIDKNYYNNIDIIKAILECCNYCIDSDKTYLIAYMTKFNLLSQQNQFSAAIRCYDLYIQTNNNNSLQNDQYQSILQFCDRFIQNEQNNPLPYIKKGQILQQMKDFQAAMLCYDQYRNIDPNYYQNDQFFEAFIQCCDQYIDSDQINHIPYYKKAQILEEKKDFKDSLQIYEQFIQRNSAQYLLNDQLYTNVVKCCDWYIMHNKSDHIPHLKKAQILRQKGFFKEAQYCYDQCIKISNNQCIYEAILNKGQILKQDKQYKEAILCFDKCIEMDPTKTEAKLLKKETEDLIQCVIQ